MKTYFSSGPLKRYRKKHITLTLPEGKTINNIKWFYVWCDEFAVSKTFFCNRIQY